MLDSEIERIARTHGLRLLLQFGSTVSGDVHQRSDVDLAVLVEHAPLGLDQHSRLLHELQALFPHRDVDLAVLNHADPLFLKKVMEQCRLLYGAPKELRRLQLHAFRRYQDHRRYLDLERRFVAKVITARPAAVDRELVTRKMALILEDVRAITALAQTPLDDYLARPVDEVLAERYLERVIGRMILPPPFASRLAACTGLRNRLVHEYEDIDPRLVHEGLQSAVRDIPEYLRRIHEHVDRLP